jgi:CelD/BcsL family acetyltransferase involved in cellulose biosynthesis
LPLYLRFALAACIGVDACPPKCWNSALVMAEERIQIVELGREWVLGACVAWSDLLRQSNANSVFSSWAWISSWLETLGAKADVWIIGVFKDDRLIALLPLCIKRSAGTICGKHLSLVGAGKGGADYSDLLCMRGYEEVVAETIAEWLTRSTDWNRCEFADVLPDSVARRVATLMVTDNVIADASGSVCPRVCLGCGWENLLRSHFDKKHRYNIVRQVRLAEEQGLRMVFHETPEAFSRAFPMLVFLHNERKSIQRMKSAFSRPDCLRFHTRAAAKLAESGSAFIATLQAGQETVSAAYCFRDSQSLYYFQTGMSATGAALGAGSTLLYMLIRWAANQGYEWFDLLKGEEAYKTPWATDRVEQRAIKITRTNWRGRCLVALDGARRALSALQRQNT